MIENFGAIFEAKVNADFTNYKVIYDNTDGIPESNTSTFRVNNLSGPISIIGGSLGHYLKRLEGTCIIEVYTPKGDGVRLNESLCDVALNAFLGALEGTIQFYRAEVQRIGEEEEKSLFHQNVIIYYRYDYCD